MIKFIECQKRKFLQQNKNFAFFFKSLIESKCWGMFSDKSDQEKMQKSISMNKKKKISTCE